MFRSSVETVAKTTGKPAFLRLAREVVEEVAKGGRRGIVTGCTHFVRRIDSRRAVCYSDFGK
jgi:hypothetical protein